MTLLKRDSNAPAAWYGNLPVTSRYTFGLAGEKFFRTLKDEGRILGTRCPECERVYVPATLFCERCMEETGEWVDVGTHGTVHTFTVLFEDLDGKHMKTPEVIAFVRLGDGGIVHRLAEVDLGDIFIGMPVEAVLKPAKERQGSILDIAHFRPVSD